MSDFLDIPKRGIKRTAAKTRKVKLTPDLAKSDANMIIKKTVLPQSREGILQAMKPDKLEELKRISGNKYVLDDLYRIILEKALKDKEQWALVYLTDKFDPPREGYYIDFPEVPRIRTLNDAIDFMDKIMAGLIEKALTNEEAAFLFSLVERQLKVIESSEIIVLYNYILQIQEAVNKKVPGANIQLISDKMHSLIKKNNTV
jgi:hypothetical protein